MSNGYPQIRLLPGRHRRVAGGHPWAYSNELDMTDEVKALPPGGLVVLTTHAGEAVGVAGFNPHSLIAARLIDRQPKAIVDTDFLAARLQRCLEMRERLFDSPSYRLVHADADGLPGLVVDRFGDAVAVQLNAAMMDRLRESLLAALDAVLAPRIVVLRNDSPVRRLEGLETGVETVIGDASEPVELSEGGVTFLADLAGGQKTGWFYDQRDNRRFVASLARDARVLDVYCHTGGFAVHAAAAGAHSVVAVDKSAASLALAEQAAERNGCGDRCSFVKADAFNEMERLAAANERYQVVVADPPAFVKSKKDLKAGIKGYRKMMRLAARLTAPGGYLFVASCSHNMTPELFDEQMRKTLSDANRTARILRRSGAAADHPTHPWLPESGYLKALVLQLD
ncbi:MAG: class I SAM-dependent rRNA methyltransferase [Alphaproteobacteria bacterium]|nr:class I SAM-dependent rRNA methyltransferase [Alphaproteobacteria bacterium]